MWLYSKQSMWEDYNLSNMSGVYNNSEITKEIKKMQHEIKNYAEQTFKKTINKSVDYAQVDIYKDMIILRGKGFLTQAEKYIINSSEDGIEKVKNTRLVIADQFSINCENVIEEITNAKILHQFTDLDVKNDFTVHIIILDRIIT